MNISYSLTTRHVFIKTEILVWGPRIYSEGFITFVLILKSIRLLYE